jgi:hypothetical protein
MTASQWGRIGFFAIVSGVALKPVDKQERPQARLLLTLKP